MKPHIRMKNGRWTWHRFTGLGALLRTTDEEITQLMDTANATTRFTDRLNQQLVSDKANKALADQLRRNVS